MAKTSPLLQAAATSVDQRSLREVEANLETHTRAHVVRWARGEATLMEIKGYDEEDLYFIAQQAYALFLNGRFQDAQTMFEGLVAIDPRNDYYHRALGVVYQRRGDSERALRQFTHALRVDPRSTAAYVNRAEIHIYRREMRAALDDLDHAIRVAQDPMDPVVRKAHALRTLLLRDPR